MHSICNNLVPNHFPRSERSSDYEEVWGSLPQDKAFIFGYTVENGKATFDPSLGDSPPPQDYDKSNITSRVQSHLNHFAWLKSSGIKLQIGVIRYPGKKK
jgi:hypothetical protein